MAADDSAEHPDEGRVKDLLDRLAAILRGLPADRQQAFREYLDEQIKEADHGGDAAEGDRGQR